MLFSDLESTCQRSPLTAHLARGGAYEPRSLDALRIADDDLRDVLEGRRRLLFDGGMGTMLQAAGLAAGEAPELLNLTDRDAVTQIHAAYVAAGAEVVTTNTFGANPMKLGDDALVEEVYRAGVAAARAAGARYVAGDMGPLGTLLRPLGTLSFDEAYRHFALMARAADRAGADLIVIETMTDLAEMKAAVLAAKEQTDLPVFATMTFEADGRTFLGTSPEIAAVSLEALGADVLGVNCSLGPTELRPLVVRMLGSCSKPVMVQANAGLPRSVDGETVYDITPDEYARAVRGMVDDGVAVIGGCCGTTPDFIRLLAPIVAEGAPRKREPAHALTAASACSLVRLADREIAVIGERINPTGKRRLQEALRRGDVAYVVGQGISPQEQGADVLDVNVGLPGIDEASVMERVVEELGGACTLPLQIDSSDPAAIEAAVRRAPGKPIINSVNGKREVMDAVLPLAAHYGCDIVALTLDERGIPSSAAERVAIAERIIDEAARYGIGRERILVDCLVMTASTNQDQVSEILEALAACKGRLGVRTSLGVSNVSFGLPARELINATFLAAALGAGLDAAIMNPGSERYMDVIRAFRVLNAEDAGSVAFIDRYAGWDDPYKVPRGRATAPSGAGTRDGASDGAATDAGPADGAGDGAGEVRALVLSGRKGDMPTACERALEAMEPMELVNRCLIPALDEVGERFDRGEYFLPQLMASAEAARSAFDVVRAHVPESANAGRGAVCLATVKGDIHDIGKNIVKMLLENYGFTVVDLGRDVDPGAVVEAARRHRADLVGLSALMTTTVPAMRETIELLHREAPGVKVMVGGAVLTPDYAREIGADFYAKDAAEAARIAERTVQ